MAKEVNFRCLDKIFRSFLNAFFLHYLWYCKICVILLLLISSSAWGLGSCCGCGGCGNSVGYDASSLVYWFFPSYHGVLVSLPWLSLSSLLWLSLCRRNRSRHFCWCFCVCSCRCCYTHYLLITVVVGGVDVDVSIVDTLSIEYAYICRDSELSFSWRSIPVACPRSIIGGNVLQRSDLAFQWCISKPSSGIDGSVVEPTHAHRRHDA